MLQWSPLYCIQRKTLTFNYMNTNLVHEIESFSIKAPFRFKVIRSSSSNITIRMYRGDEEVGFLRCLTSGLEVWFESGRTYSTYRRLGYGTWMRAVVTWCAKRAGYTSVHQIASYLNNTPKTNRPTSAYIMNKLGFGYGPRSMVNSPSKSPTEYRILNLSRNIPHVNAIIRNIRQ